MTRIFALIIIVNVVITVGSPLEAQTDSVVSYQGQLKQNGSPITSPGCDFEFSLFADAGGVTQIGNTQTIVGVAVTDGLFTVELNSGNEFGPTAFIGDERFLEIAVKCPPEVSFTPLSPLQPITPAPYALALPGMRTMPSGSGNNPDSPNVIGGSRENSIAIGIAGATISGGGTAEFSNSAAGNFSTVGGGAGNDASGSISTIGGGQINDASGVTSTIGGGIGNDASGIRSTIGGGLQNNASGGSSTIGGGSNNHASGATSTIGGGFVNIASGSGSTVPGGENNEANGEYSFAAGYGAKADHDGTFVWSDSTSFEFGSTGANQFLIKASGGVGIGTTNPGSALHIRHDALVGASWGIRISSAATSNNQGGMRISNEGFFDVTNKANIGAPNFARLNSGGVWTVVSDRRMKEEIAPLTGVLDRAMRLDPVSYWYKNQDRARIPDRQIGLIAQEVDPLFPSLVSHGDDLLTMDYNGLGVVAIAAIQELKQQTDVEMNELRDETDARRDENNDLRTRLDALEQQDADRQQQIQGLQRLVEQLNPTLEH